MIDSTADLDSLPDLKILSLRRNRVVSFGHRRKHASLRTLRLDGNPFLRVDKPPSSQDGVAAARQSDHFAVLEELQF